MFDTPADAPIPTIEILADRGELLHNDINDAWEHTAWQVQWRPR
jgi:hypothetical protein